MTISIGFRASPSDVNFAIYDSEDAKVVNVEILRIPQSFDVPDALKFVRSNILDILREFKVEQAGIRTTEPMAKSVDLRRVQIEGVIQEAFASSDLAGFYAGPIAVITSRLGVEKDQFKPAIAGENSFDIESWEEMSANAREALLAALGAVNV
jgi:hypothetical protein